MEMYFSIEELTASETAKRLGIDNTPPREAVAKMDDLIRRVLNPVRAKWGHPLTATSGYRSAELNRAVGGVVGSQHLTGEAADITTGSREANRLLFGIIVEMTKGKEGEPLVFDQLIDEKNYSWLHISYRAAGNNRRKVLHL